MINYIKNSWGSLSEWSRLLIIISPPISYLIYHIIDLYHI